MHYKPWQIRAKTIELPKNWLMMQIFATATRGFSKKSFRAAKSLATTLKIVLTTVRPGSTGGHFGAVPPKPLLVPPKREVCPPCEGCAPKKSSRSGATGMHFGACAPQNTACAPESVSKLRSKKENTSERETEPKILSQRWSPRGRPWHQGRPRGHILKSFNLASKSQVLKNCPVLGSRTALFFVPLKCCWKTPETLRKICRPFFVFRNCKSAEKNF